MVPLDRNHGKAYEVWNLMANYPPHFASDDPVEIVHWLRENREKSIYSVYLVGKNFHRDKMIAHDFISKHRMAAADDIVKKAFEAGKPEGLAQELNDLFFGR